jgi:hypothetical protein
MWKYVEIYGHDCQITENKEWLWKITEIGGKSWTVTENEGNARKCIKMYEISENDGNRRQSAVIDENGKR